MNLHAAHAQNYNDIWDNFTFLSRDPGGKINADRVVKIAGQKGSDVSARDSTRKIVAASRQLEALQSILKALGVPHINPNVEHPPIQNNRVNKAYWTPKNTIVRDVLNEIGNQHRHG